jgi:hypothetical protein
MLKLYTIPIFTINQCVYHTTTYSVISYQDGPTKIQWTLN